MDRFNQRFPKAFDIPLSFLGIYGWIAGEREFPFFYYSLATVGSGGVAPVLVDPLSEGERLALSEVRARLRIETSSFSKGASECIGDAAAALVIVA